jgi:hypothetical protein
MIVVSAFSMFFAFEAVDRVTFAPLIANASMLSAQTPSHFGISYMNHGQIKDVMRFPAVKMYNLPITHNKSSERWKNVRV